MTMRKLRGALLAALFCCASAQAAVSSIDLSQYQLAATYSLPTPQANEASAVTWNWDTGTLFVLGDEGDALVEVTTSGALVSSMSLTGFDDTEGLTYIGGGRFALVEERLQDVFAFNYSAGGTLARASLQTASLGPTVGNVGLEGISYDPLTGSFIVVKEKTPQAVNIASINFTTGLANVAALFTPNLGTLDLSDVQVLSTVAAPGSPDAQNLLIYSQESGRLMEVDRLGSVLSMFDLSSVSDSAEGVTIGADGTIYIVDESPNLYVLRQTPVPLPAAAWLLISGIAGLGWMGRRSRGASTSP